MGVQRPRAGQVTCMLFCMLLAPAVMAQDRMPAPPLPPPRPDQPAPLVPEEPSREPSADERAEENKEPEKDEAKAACLERLKQLGLKFESRPPVQEKNCGIENPVLVSALPNDVQIVPASLMACPAAESLTRWVSEVVAPEAERQFQSAPTKVLIGTSYQCRDQRNGEKLSEHAFGNGLDIMGFEFAKHAPLAIGSPAENSPEAAFQSAIQKAACPIFNTVLGPGSDAAHGDHLHLDLRQRKGDYRICQ